MRTITLEAATPDTGRALYSALSSFYPEFDTDHEGRCFVSVSVSGRKETHAVLDTIQQHLGGRAHQITSWVTSTAPASLLPQSRGNGRSP